MKEIPRFVVYIRGQIQGPMDIEDLWKLEGFSLDTSVCQAGDDTWQAAREFSVIAKRGVFIPPAPNVAPAPAAVEAQERRDWRQAIVPSNAPDASEARRYSAPVIQSGDRVGRASPSQPPRWRFDWSRWQKLFQRQRKTVLLSGLLLVFTGLYAPQTGLVLAICDGLVTPDLSVPATRLLGRTSRQIGPRHWKRVTRPHFTLTRAATAAPESNVVEIGSEDLGNGFIEKTVVVTRMVDGAEVHETKTLMVPAKPAKAPHHRRKRMSYLPALETPVS